MGFVYERKKDLAGAEAEDRLAVDLDPGRGDSFTSLVRVLLLTRQRDEALKVIADAVTRFPQDGRALQTAQSLIAELKKAH
jgi:hypothetical protein